MAHFARIEEGVVQEVIAISNDDCNRGEYPGSEEPGKLFIRSLGLSGEWIQASYSGSFRHRFPSKGFTYDPTKDAFISYQPYSSWFLNSDLEWQSPKAYPNDGENYKWDDILQEWVPLDFLPPGILDSLEQD
jgi:hypothetical protein